MIIADINGHNGLNTAGHISKEKILRGVWNFVDEFL